MAVFHGPQKLADYEADGSLHESITCAEQTTWDDRHLLLSLRYSRRWRHRTNRTVYLF